jgi:hypothetical protein
VLIAGWPSYLFARDSGGKPRSIGADTILGVIIDRHDRARTFRSPVASRMVGGVRALGREDGGWDVVFAELISFSRERFPQPDTAARLWYGVHDGRRWKSLEEIPRPAGFIFHPRLGSQLVRSGETLSWALRATNPGGRINIVVLNGRRGRWASEIVATPSAAYVQLTEARRSGPLLAVVRADTSLRPGDSNSLFIYSRSPEWLAVRRIARGGAEPANHPSFVRSGGDILLTWYVDKPGGGEVRMLRNPGVAPLRETAALSTGFSGGRPVAYASLRTGAYWIIDYRPPEKAAAELRFFHDTGGGVGEVTRWPSPFLGGFHAAAVQESSFVLAGAVWKDQDSIPVTLLVRVAPQCEAAARRR